MKFKCLDQNDQERTLEEFSGKWLVLYFYPRDLTSGCTKEAEGFRDLYKEFKAAGAEILGVSCDGAKSHQKFIEKLDLPFDLLVDEDKKVVNEFGVWVEKSMYGKKYMGISRETFLFGPDGKVVKHYAKVKPAEHAEEVLAEIKAN